MVDCRYNALVLSCRSCRPIQRYLMLWFETPTIYYSHIAETQVIKENLSMLIAEVSKVAVDPRPEERSSSNFQVLGGLGRSRLRSENNEAIAGLLRTQVLLLPSLTAVATVRGLVLLQLLQGRPLDFYNYFDYCHYVSCISYNCCYTLYSHRAVVVAIIIVATLVIVLEAASSA